MIDTFVVETLIPGQTDFTNLSKNAENAMRSLLNLLVPKTVVELDNHIDAELLLLAAYQLYGQRFNAFASLEQRNAFGIRVIGLIQSALLPETAKIFCQGPCDVVLFNEPVGPHAASLKLSDDKSFYRADRESLSDLGGKFVANVSDGIGVTGVAEWQAEWMVQFWLQNLCQQKHQTCSAYLMHLPTAPASAYHMSSSECVIC